MWLLSFYLASWLYPFGCPPVLCVRWLHWYKAVHYTGVYVLLCQPKRAQIGPQTLWRATLVGSSSSEAFLPPVSLCARWRMCSPPHSSSGAGGETVLSQPSWHDSAKSQQPSLSSRDPSSLPSPHPLCSKKLYPFQGSTLEVKFN